MNILDALHFPNFIGQMLFTLSLILILSTYFPNQDIGIFKTLKVDKQNKKRIRRIGVVLLFISLLLFAPLFNKSKNSATNATQPISTDMHQEQNKTVIIENGNYIEQNNNSTRTNLINDRGQSAKNNKIDSQPQVIKSDKKSIISGRVLNQNLEGVFNTKIITENGEEVSSNENGQFELSIITEANQQKVYLYYKKEGLGNKGQYVGVNQRNIILKF